MGRFGSSTPRALIAPTGAANAFPRSAANPYVSPDGAIVVPGGAMDGWFTYRNTLGVTRGDVIGIGDSTMYGSGGLYSFLQRLRDKASGATTGGPAGFGMLDGGKGMFASGEGAGGSPIAYDAPEINGFVSTTFNTGPDAFDNTDGQYYCDNGSPANHTVVMQFRGTAARLWYSTRNGAGDFTYVVQNGATTVASGTVQAYVASALTVSKYVYLSGLAANTTHTITVTNLATSTNGGPASGAGCWIALAPMNDTGVVFQKYATSGDTFNLRFYGGLGASAFQDQYGMRYQTALGLTPTIVTTAGNYRGATVDNTQPAGGAINPVLAFTNLGFNDLTNSVAGDEAKWTEYVKRFAGACADANCSGIVISGQMPYNANWATLGASRFTALKTQALASGLVFVDLFYPIGGPALSYSGGSTNPHLSKAQYQTQADYLWDNLLGVV